MRDISLNCSFVTIIHNSHEKMIANAFKELIDPFFRGHLTIKKLDVEILSENEVIPESLSNDISKSRLIALIMDTDNRKNYMMNFILGIAWVNKVNVVIVNPEDVDFNNIYYPLDNFPQINVKDKQTIYDVMRPIVTLLTGQQNPFINVESFLKKVAAYERQSSFWDKCQEVVDIIKSIDPKAIYKLSDGENVEIMIKDYQLHELEKWNNFLSDHNFLNINQNSYVALKDNGIYISVTISPRSAFNSIMKNCSIQSNT